MARIARLLRREGVDRDYAAAWDDWEASGEQHAWDVTAADGVGDPAR